MIFNTKLKLTAIGFGLGAFALMYAGCKQQEPNVKSETTKQDETMGIQFREPEDAKEIKERIADFKQKIIDLYNDNSLNNASREDKTSLEELEWGIEAVLNATYGHADFNMGSHSVVTTTFTVDSDSEGKVSNQDLLKAYNDAYQSIVDHYNQLQTTVKTPVLIDIEKLETKERASTTTYQVTSVYATSSSLALPTTNCSVFSQSYNWEPAATQLANQVNNRKPLPNGHAYFTGTKPGAWLTPDQQRFKVTTNRPNWRSSLIFTYDSWVPDPVAGEIINTADMNWYYCSLWQAIDMVRPAPSPNYNYLQIIYPDTYRTGSTQVPIYNHKFVPMFGQSIQCPCPAPCVPTTPLYLCTCC